MLTADRLYVHDEVFGVPKVFRLEEVESVERGKDIVINGRRTLRGVDGGRAKKLLVEVVAGLRGGDPALGLPSPDAQLPSSADPSISEILARWRDRVPSRTIFITPEIPVGKRVAALESYARGARGEGILMLADIHQQGLLLTLENRYLGSPVEKSRVLKVGEIRDVAIQESRLLRSSVTVNGTPVPGSSREEIETIAGLLNDLLPHFVRSQFPLSARRHGLRAAPASTLSAGLCLGAVERAIPETASRRHSETWVDTGLPRGTIGQGMT